LANNLTMADLLAKSNFKPLSRGEEAEGTVVAILKTDIILDLGSKSEGVLSKKDLTPSQAQNLEIGSKITATVVYPENESGQVVLGFIKPTNYKGFPTNPKFTKFEQALRNNQVITGKGVEVNKGGLIVEVGGVRGFLPSSQVALSQASNLDGLIDKDIVLTVIEVDANQNRLIFSQKTTVSDETKDKLSKLKVGDKVNGKVAAVLQFGVFASLEDGVEGLVHISEISWEKVEDPSTLYKVGDEIEAIVVSIDSGTGKVNLSIKQLSKDPFTQKAKDLQPDDVVKGTVTKVSSAGVFVELDNGLEGLLHTSKIEPTDYPIGKTLTLLVDSVDSQKRRVNVVPFVTSTKDLIYK